MPTRKPKAAPKRDRSGALIVMAANRGALTPVLVDEEPPRSISITVTGYAQMRLDGHVVLLHRFVLGLTPGDGLFGDHINGDRLDNRRENLRIVTPSESNQNVSGRGRVPYLGVHQCRVRWQASGRVAGVRVHLGTFDTPEEAGVVALEWRRQNAPLFVDRHALSEVAS